MSLVKDLVGLAEAEGCQFARLSAGRVRYGAADAILSAAGGDIAVHHRRDGGYDVAVWHGDVLAAWGQTADAGHIAEVMCRWEHGALIAELCVDGFLQEAREAPAGDAVEAQWQLLLRHGDAFLQPIAVAAAAHPTLRRLRPWVSHSTLHLLDFDDQTRTARRGLAFHRPPAPHS